MLSYVRCHNCDKEGGHYTREHIGDVLYVQSKVVSEERVHQGFNQRKTKIDDEESNDKVQNGLCSKVKEVVILKSVDTFTLNTYLH